MSDKHDITCDIKGCEKTSTHVIDFNHFFCEDHYNGLVNSARDGNGSTRSETEMRAVLEASTFTMPNKHWDNDDQRTGFLTALEWVLEGPKEVRK